MLKEILKEHVLDPKNTEKMYNLAREYDKLEQGAAAISFYIRAADLEHENKELQYKCMVYSALAFQRQGGRNHTVVGMLQHAIGLLPERPEAHYFLAKHGEAVGDWRLCQIHSKLGYIYLYAEPIGIEWPGEKELEFLQAHSLWGISGVESGRLAFFDLIHRRNYDDEFKEYVSGVLDRVGWPDAVPYTAKDQDRLNMQFKGFKSIEKNYSKHFQDMFVLACLNGKRNGTYLEIGAGDPFIHNNTALLETQFDWKGISIEWSAHLAYDFAQRRNNTILNANALEVDFEDLLVKHCMETTIDFLQIDTDESSIEILRNMPFDRFKFNVVQFEHDAYRLDTSIRDEARRILSSKGYKLACPNLSFRPGCPYEDWYVHESIADNVHPRVWDGLRNIDGENLFWDYMIK